MPPLGILVRRRAFSVRMAGPQAWPAPRAGSTCTLSATKFAVSLEKPSFSSIPGMPRWKAAASGYLAEAAWSSSSREMPERGLKPSYQISKGSSGLFSLEAMRAAASAPSRASRRSVNIFSASASGISRSSLNLRSIWVGSSG